MSRHELHFTSKGLSTFKNVRRAPTSEPLVHLDVDEIKVVKLNFADYLDTGETVSSATATAYNCTAGISTSSPTVTLTISAATSYDLDGRIVVVVTMSSGEKHRQVVRVRRTNRYRDEEVGGDYS